MLAAAIGAFALLCPNSSSAATSEENSIIGTLDAVFEAERLVDFSRLALLVHPRTQHLFRDILSARTDVLLRSYSQAQISAVSGLSAHPKDLVLSDRDFFVYTCNVTKSRHPDFATEWKRTPFTLEGSTFDTDHRAHVVLSWPGSVHTERTEFNYLGSVHIFLSEEQSQWLLWSCPFAERIGDFWCHDLLTMNGSAATLK